MPALDSREASTPERYAKLQLARLDRAMMVVDEAMNDANLAAAPALRQLQAQHDRYEGFAAWLTGRKSSPDSGQDSAPKFLNNLSREPETGASRSPDSIGDEACLAP